MSIQDALVTLFLDQTMGKERWSQQNYERVSRTIENHTEEELVELLNYIKEHPLPYNTSLKELFHKNSVWRNIDSYKIKERKPLSGEDPYSVSMLLDL